MAIVKLFGPLRDAAGWGSRASNARTLKECADELETSLDEPAIGLLRTCRIWVNGDSVPATHQLAESDEVAFLPPVSGG